MRRLPLAIALGLAMAAAGCSDPGNRPPGTGHAADAAPSTGTTNPVFLAGSWKAGDAASWNEQMRRRAENQNEYGRVQP